MQQKCRDSLCSHPSVEHTHDTQLMAMALADLHTRLHRALGSAEDCPICSHDDDSL